MNARGPAFKLRVGGFAERVDGEAATIYADSSLLSITMRLWVCLIKRGI